LHEEVNIPLIEKTLYYNQDKAFQFRLTVSEFNGVMYINIRKYFQDFEGDFIPSKEGASFPLTVSSLTALLEGLLEIATKADKDEALEAFFKGIKDDK
jgi:hypothetical protein